MKYFADYRNHWIWLYDNTGMNKYAWVKLVTQMSESNAYNSDISLENNIVLELQNEIFLRPQQQLALDI
jgi:hypothetical protein